MELIIRKGTEADFPQLVALFKEFAHFEKLPDKMVNSVEKMQAQQDYFQCFVAVNGANRIVGYAAYFYAYYTWSGKSVFMDDLFVTQTYRGKGIGTKLLKQVVEEARKAGCFKVRWQVSNWNTSAQNFYTKMGAKIDEVEINCDLIL